MVTSNDDLQEIIRQLHEIRKSSDAPVRLISVHDLRRIEEALECVEQFKGDSETLKRMIAVFNALEGWIKITKAGGLIVVFIVLAWTNWDRLVDLMRGGK